MSGIADPFNGRKRLLRFNHRNDWRLAGGVDGYCFACEDWRFGRNGFPIASP